jgi:hypothetical protein
MKKVLVFSLILCLFTIHNIMFAPVDDNFIRPSDNGRKQDLVAFFTRNIPVLHDLLESDSYKQMSNRAKYHLSDIERKKLYGEKLAKSSAEIEQKRHSLEVFLNFKYDNDTYPFHRIYHMRTDEKFAKLNDASFVDTEKYYNDSAKKLPFLSRIYFLYVRPYIPYKIIR